MIGIVPEGYVTLRDSIKILAGIKYHQPGEIITRLNRLGHEIEFTIEELEASARYFWSEADAGRITILAEQPNVGRVVEISPAVLSTVPSRAAFRAPLLTFFRLQMRPTVIFEKTFGARRLAFNCSSERLNSIVSPRDCGLRDGERRRLAWRQKSWAAPASRPRSSLQLPR